jgi:hypothetical protein
MSQSWAELRTADGCPPPDSRVPRQCSPQPRMEPTPAHPHFLISEQKYSIAGFWSWGAPDIVISLQDVHGRGTPGL